MPLRMDGGGTRHFVESLLLELTGPRFANRYLFLFFCIPEMRAHLDAVFRNASNVAVVSARGPADIEDSRQCFDLYFSPLNSLSPVLPDCPSVACLMDIQEKYLPEFFSPGDLEARRVCYGSLVREATITCTISQFCRQTFLDKMGADPEKVKTVRLYPQKRLLDCESLDPPGCPSEFILYPANWYAHKNVRNLLHGYLSAKRMSPDLPPLVLVGHTMGSEDWLRELTASDALAENIHIYTEITPEKLRFLYERCRFVVLPTRFEGYCMPLAEAIIFNCPVLANDLPVMREIGGDWPIYARMNDADEIAPMLVEMHRTGSTRSARPLPPALTGWGWSEIASEYEAIFHEALIKHRIESLRV